MKLAAARFSRTSIAGAVACLMLMAGIGGYIFYNTHVLNPYRSAFSIDDARAQYEKKYKQYFDTPQPRVTDVVTQVDFYPEERSIAMHGTMWLENKTSAPIDRVAITVWPVDLIPVPRRNVKVERLSIAGGQTPIIEDRPWDSMSISFPRRCRRKAGSNSTMPSGTTILALKTLVPTPTSSITARSSTIATDLTSDMRRRSS